jgi:hypothetical protein
MLGRIRRFFNVQGSGMKAPRRIFWVAFALRLAYMALAHTYRIRTFDGNFSFAWEAGRIAKALVTGYGYSDPFANSFLAHTGPTAWLPPAYPLLIAAAFRVFGIYSPASAIALIALNCFASALTAAAVWEIGARCFNPRIALWSAWVWALHPAAMQYAVRWIWETTLTTALFAWVIVLALRMRHISPGKPAEPVPERPQTIRWLLLGLAWALIALLNSTLLLFLPIFGLWILRGLWNHPANRPRTLRNATLALLVFAACLAPWIHRNWQQFHAFIPLRGNFGAELYMGDGPGSTGLLMTWDDPNQLHLYAAMGEVRYARMRGTAAKQFIQSHPAHFAAIVAKRIYFYWAGVPSDDRWPAETARILNFAFISVAGLLGLALALVRRIPAAGLFAWAFALLPLTYYLVTVHARFRHPLEPLLCVLAVYLFQSADRTRIWSLPPQH